MAALTTTDQLLELLKKSRLVDDARLDAFLQNRPAPLPTRPRPLAELLIRRGFITTFQASQLLSGKWRGFLVAGGKYKLLELLGVGGMGKVYLCEHVRMKRLVALKVLPSDKLDEPTALERFEREARAAAALDHPNIVRAHDLDIDPIARLHFLVMEFVDGTSLHDLVKKFGPMEITRAAHCIAQAAEGLQHAHEAGWIHRDIKPGNLLLDRTGMIKILDMGLARFFHDDGSNPLTNRYEKNAVLGTADFLAPEQAVDSTSVDIRADIYALGSTFYFLLTGRGPFDHGTVAEKLLWHQMHEPEPVRALRPDVPKEMEAIVSKMMAKKPDYRYQEPVEVVVALKPWIDTPIGPPTDAEMPRLCPALDEYRMVGTSLPASGSGPISSSRLRGGPRTGSHSRASMARILAAHKARNRRWLIAGSVGGMVLLGLVVGLLWWLVS